MYEEIERDMPEADYKQMDNEELARWATDPAAKKEIDKRAEAEERAREEEFSHRDDDKI